MTIAIICLLICVLLPFATVGIAKYKRGFDNNNPRDWLAGLQEGYRKRAHAAHLNHFESFPPFAAAIIIAMMRGVNATTIDMLAIAFVLCRVVFTWAYVKDYASFRTVVWSAGLLCVVTLFVLAIIK
jgi:uncharacterized MAPEG superfamily protein